jgi:hypothetical protein
VFLRGINGSKRVAKTWKMMKDVVGHHLTEPMKVLRKCGIRCIQVEVEVSNDWILHRDKAPAHKVLPVKQFLAQITEIEHSLYPPDLVLNEFCFQK